VILLLVKSAAGPYPSSLRIGDDMFAAAYASAADQTPEDAIKLRTWPWPSTAGAARVSERSVENMARGSDRGGHTQHASAPPLFICEAYSELPGRRRWMSRPVEQHT
jgi:hypothetical protein